MNKVKLHYQMKFSNLLELDWNSFVEVAGFHDGVQVKRRLCLEQQGRCNRCNCYEWQGEEVPLELEHKNGNHYDLDRLNVEVLCPNCHALTPTWRGRNSSKRVGKVSEEDLLAALKKEPTVSKALISCGLAGKGGNYKRCYSILAKHGLLT